MKKPLLIGGVLAILALGGYAAKAALAKRDAQTPGAQAVAPAPGASAPQKTATVELLTQDLFTVASGNFERSLPLSGSLKAAETAVIKSKLGGDVVQLTVREGEVVTRGQVLARIDDTEFRARAAQARNTHLAAVAQVEIAQRSFETNKSLVDKEFISKTALDTSLNNLQAAKANSAAAKAALDVAEKSLGDVIVRTPISGVVSARLVQQGEKVGVDARLLEVVNLATLELEASVPAGDITAVKPGQKATLTLDGDKPLTFNASVARINPATLGTSRAVMVYLKLASTEGLRQGMFMQGNLAVGSVMQTTAVPLSAVRLDAPRPYVFVIEGDKVVSRFVTLGERSSATAETIVQVLGGLTAGDRVVKGSVGALQNGAAVKLVALADRK
jgi:RND family efflux transporter MFP subunit